MPLAPNLVLENVDASVLGFSFSDGRQTIDAGELGVDVSFLYSTDASANIVGWSFLMRHTPLPTDPGDPSGVSSLHSDQLSSFDGAQFGICVGGTSGCSLSIDEAKISDAPGTWSVVPEPSTVALTGLGMLGIGLARARCPGRERRIVRRAERSSG